MINTVIGKTFTVGEMIEELQKFPKDMPMSDDGYYPICGFKIKTWEDSNYPYNRPDTEFVTIVNYD